ncbi:MAG: hypothetical protein ACMG6E_04120, partial [Candidatus Roizmanbacteria bacterium]
ESCAGRICFIVVPYNKCGQAGKCKEIQFADIDCIVDSVNAWVVQNDCRGLEVRWDCHKCCTFVHIYVDGQEVDVVPCGDKVYRSEGIGCCAELAVACATTCGMGERTVVIPGCPEGTMSRTPEEIILAQNSMVRRKAAGGRTQSVRMNRRKH